MVVANKLLRITLRRRQNPSPASSSAASLPRAKKSPCKPARPNNRAVNIQRRWYGANRRQTAKASSTSDPNARKRHYKAPRKAGAPHPNFNGRARRRRSRPQQQTPRQRVLPSNRSDHHRIQKQQRRGQSTVTGYITITLPSPGQTTSSNRTSTPPAGSIVPPTEYITLFDSSARRRLYI